MFAASFFGTLALLYYASFGVLLCLVIFIAWQGWRRPRRQRLLRRLFLGLALCLFGWQFTLFAEVRTPLPVWQLVLGRLNFAVMALLPVLCLRFVQEVPRPPPHPTLRALWALWLETALVTSVTLFSPWVDAHETVASGQALATYGALFPLYLLHVTAYWVLALLCALRERGRTFSPVTRDQLTLLAGGMLLTGAVAFVTNALLPYGWGDFRFCEVGVLSAFGFVSAVAYTTLVLRLFDLGVFVRKGLVYGLLLTLAIGIYSSAVALLSQHLTENAGSLAQFVVLLIAFSFDPLRRLLEKKVDNWLFEDEEDESTRKARDG